MVRNVALAVILLVICDASKTSNVPKLHQDQITGMLAGSSFDVKEEFDFPEDSPHDNFICPHDHLACPGQLQPQNKYKTRIWACAPKQEIQRMTNLTHQQFDSNVKGLGFQRFSTKCNEVKTIGNDERVFKVVARFNASNYIRNINGKHDSLSDYCVAFKSNEDYRVFEINDKDARVTKRIEDIDKIKFSTGEELKFTEDISYKSIVCGKWNDIESAIKDTQNVKPLTQNQTTVEKNKVESQTSSPAYTKMENIYYVSDGSNKIYIDKDITSVPPIIVSNNFENEKSSDYQMDLLTCPNNFALCNFKDEKQKCIPQSKVTYKPDILCQLAPYCIDEMLFGFLPALNKYINEEEIKQNKIKREYIVMVTQYKDEAKSTTYYEVPKLNFEISELMKRDAILKMKTKNEPIQVNILMKIINIELVPRKGPAWIDRHCGKLAILLFFVLLFLRHYVYEKIIRMKSDNGDEDESEDDGNDDEENDDDEIGKRDEGMKNDGKTELVASEI